MMANQKTDYVEDEEALFNSFSSPVLYYVQSPSTVSHANGNNNELALVLSSPYQSENYVPPRRNNPNHDVARFILSRYSSHGSNNTFIHEKKISYDLQSHQTTVGTESGETGTLLRICGVEEHEKEDNDIHHNDKDYVDDYEEDDYGIGGKSSGLGRYFSFGTSPSCYWISLQISWRLLVSLCAALLVFYLATNPPPPVMSVKVTGIPQFGLGEGVDQSGVTTKILTCNSTMDLNVDNKSKLFGLHVRASVIQMSFGPVVFANSQGPKLYAKSHTRSTFNLYVGVKSKPMYGAGRNMQDMLKSGKGLPLIIKLRLRSNFKVVWKLINPNFHHNVECMLVLHGDLNKHPNQAYSSNCRIASTS